MKCTTNWDELSSLDTMLKRKQKLLQNKYLFIKVDSICSKSDGHFFL